MRKFTVLFILALLGTNGAFAQVSEHSTGYYKDIFMDSGIRVTSRRDLPASRYLGLSIEAFVSATGEENDPFTLRDTLLQRECFCGSKIDENGILLYPDGQPRFRMIYVNGGKSGMHGRSLTPLGRSRIIDFVERGGSYVGTCAGAFMASLATSKDTVRQRDGYLGIWPGITHSTGLIKSYTSMFVEKKSPLLKYYNFGGDMRIDSVRHNGGCYADFSREVPRGTEVLLRYDYDTVSAKSKVKIHNQISAWAYKKSDSTGRVVLIGSHPEAVVSGERLDLMSSMIRYAIDGNGVVVLKAELQPGETVEMNKRTHDNVPERTAIGDRQYHHYKIFVPKGVKQMKIELAGYKWCDNFDLSLLANRGSFAFHSNSSSQEVSLGCSKTLVVEAPEAGEWYISVFCETTVDSRFGDYGTEYFGRTDVLNGVPYKLKVSF